MLSPATATAAKNSWQTAVCRLGAYITSSQPKSHYSSELRTHVAANFWADRKAIFLSWISRLLGGSRGRFCVPWFTFHVTWKPGIVSSDTTRHLPALLAPARICPRTTDHPFHLRPAAPSLPHFSESHTHTHTLLLLLSTRQSSSCQSDLAVRNVDVDLKKREET